MASPRRAAATVSGLTRTGLSRGWLRMPWQRSQRVPGIPLRRSGHAPFATSQTQPKLQVQHRERDLHLAPMETVLAGMSPRTCCSIRTRDLARYCVVDALCSARTEQHRVRPVFEICPIGLAPPILTRSDLWHSPRAVAQSYSVTRHPMRWPRTYVGLVWRKLRSVLISRYLPRIVM